MKKDKGLTVESLREYPGLEHCTDEEAEEIIETLKQLSEIIYTAVVKKDTEGEA